MCSKVVDVVNTYWAIIGLPKNVGSALRRLKYSDTLSNFSGSERHLLPLSLLIDDLFQEIFNVKKLLIGSASFFSFW